MKSYKEEKDEMKEEVAHFSYRTASPDRYEILKNFARENRQHPTHAEMLLWGYISNSQLGVKFQRQHIIGDYIADFVCIDKRLIIEVDGAHHTERQQQYDDEARTQSLQRMGFTVIRFTNEAIDTNLEDVIDKIYDYIEEA